MCISITYWKGDGVHVGTLDALKDLEKMGLFKIVSIENYHQDEWWDDMEGYDMYDESFDISISDEKDLGNTGYAFVHNMLHGLNLDYVRTEFKK